MEFPKWLVICLDDQERYVMATHRYFASQDNAIKYAHSIASSRCAFAVEVLRPIREPEE